MYITAQGPRLRNDLYCVEWDVKLYYTILYHTIALLSVLLTCECMQSMEAIPVEELKAEKFPRISAEDLIELCELSGPSKAPNPAKSSKSAKSLIVVIDVRNEDEYPL